MAAANASQGLSKALDALIPEDGDWPAASVAIDPERLMADLCDADRAWLRRLLAGATDLPALWRGVEGHAAFDRLCRALNDAYYSAPATQAQIHRLAQASPRDPDSRFNPALLLRSTDKDMRMTSQETATGITLASPPGVSPAATYEHGARCGDFIFVAGQVARDENGNWVGLGDARMQAEQVYKNIGRVLAHFGAAPHHVVKINAILIDRADRDAVTEPRLAFFGDHRPPHTGIVIAGLGSPEVRIEVEVVAYLPQIQAVTGP